MPALGPYPKYTRLFQRVGRLDRGGYYVECKFRMVEYSDEPGVEYVEPIPDNTYTPTDSSSTVKLIGIEERDRVYGIRFYEGRPFGDVTWID